MGFVRHARLIYHQYKFNAKYYILTIPYRHCVIFQMKDSLFEILIERDGDEEEHGGEEDGAADDAQSLGDFPSVAFTHVAPF